MRRPILVLLASAFVLAIVPTSASGQSSLEDELQSLINRGRGGNQLAFHSGLRVVGRQHSQEMAADGELSHSGAERRIFSAPPDPAEQNGAPDDGFTGTWCENVAYVRGSPESEVAERMYQGWTDSPSHNRCMNDERMNAAGIGFYFDGDRTYWATFESVVDQTSPGTSRQTAATRSPSATPTGTPESLRTAPPSPSPRPTPSPRATPTPRPIPTLPQRSAIPAGESTIATQVKGVADQPVTISSSRALAGPITPSAKRHAFGWIELGATLGVIAVAAEFLRRLTSRPARSGKK